VILPIGSGFTAAFDGIDRIYPHSRCHFSRNRTGIVAVAVLFYVFTAIHKDFNRKERQK
jgi:hypothetical protein